MDLIKKLWPTPFKIKKGDIPSLVLHVVVLLIVCAVVGFFIGLLSKFPILGVIFGLIGGAVEAYSVVGVILSVLVFLGTVK